MPENVKNGLNFQSVKTTEIFAYKLFNEFRVDKHVYAAYKEFLFRISYFLPNNTA